MEEFDKEQSFEKFKDVMSGSLVAKYKMTHDNVYSQEYVRRLMRIGFSEPEANNMFLFELMILKHDHIDVLNRDDYIYGALINKNEVPLPQPDSWYVEHQWFLVSEIVKIWDEAEHLWKTDRESLSEDISKRIFSITRYSGAELFISYLKMVAEKTNTSEKLIQLYAIAEQVLLFIYRWKLDVEHPYDVPQVRDRTILLKSYGTDKIRAIALLRRSVGFELSLTSAKDIIENKLPYIFPCDMTQKEADSLLEEFQKIGADAVVWPLKKPEDNSVEKALFLIPVNFGDKQEKLTEPDYSLHFGAKESEMLQQGSKVLCADLPAQFKPAETASSELLHYQTIMSRNGLRYMPLFDSYKTMVEIFGTNIRVGVICYETARSFVFKEKLAGIVVSPGGSNTIISAEKL